MSVVRLARFKPVLLILTLFMAACASRRPAPPEPKRTWQPPPGAVRILTAHLDNYVSKPPALSQPFDVLIVTGVSTGQQLAKFIQVLALEPKDWAPLYGKEAKDRVAGEVAILSRLPIQNSAKLKFYPLKTKGFGVLTTTLILPGQDRLALFAVHFPPGRPEDEAPRLALEKLNQLQSRLAKNQSNLAAGRFNLTVAQNENSKWLERLVQPHWIVATQLGCRACAPEPFIQTFFLSKDFYDGLNSRTAPAASIQALDEGRAWAVDLVPVAR